MEGIDWDGLQRRVRLHEVTRRQVLDYLLKAGGLGLVVGSGAELLAACGQEQPQTSSGGPVPPGFPELNRAITNQKITLRILLAQDYANEAPFKDLYDMFHKTYPNITLEVDNSVWEDIPTKVKTTALGGTPYDVAHYHAFEMGHIQLAEDVTDLWSKWGKVGEFLPNSLKDVTWRGKRYGVPLDVNCLFTFYNKDLFAAVKATPPTDATTWLQLKQELLKFAGQPFKAIGQSNSAWTNSGFVHSNGGDLLNSNQTQATINDSRNVAVMSLITELGWKYGVGTPPAPTKRQDEPGFLFLAKQAAFWPTGPWSVPDIKKSGINVGSAPLPKGMDGGTSGSVQGGGSLFIGKGSKNREAAFEFMKWAVALPHQIRMLKEMARWPVIKMAYTDSQVSDVARDPLLQPYFAQLQTASPYTLEAYPEADKAWSDALAAAYTGMDAKKALDEAQQKAAPFIK